MKELLLHITGNVVLYGLNGVAKWSSDTGNVGRDAYLELSGNGTLELRYEKGSTKKVLWRKSTIAPLNAFKGADPPAHHAFSGLFMHACASCFVAPPPLELINWKFSDDEVLILYETTVHEKKVLWKKVTVSKYVSFPELRLVVDWIFHDCTIFLFWSAFVEAASQFAEVHNCPRYR